MTRTDKDYAVEHAGYLASTAIDLLDAMNRLAAAEEDEDAAHHIARCEEAVSEYMKALRERVYEFRKRAERAAKAMPTEELRTSTPSTGDVAVTNYVIEQCALLVESRAGSGAYAESMGAYRILTSAAEALRGLKSNPSPLERRSEHLLECLSASNNCRKNNPHATNCCSLYGQYASEPQSHTGEKNG